MSDVLSNDPTTLGVKKVLAVQHAKVTHYVAYTALYATTQLAHLLQCNYVMRSVLNHQLCAQYSITNWNYIRNFRKQ